MRALADRSDAILFDGYLARSVHRTIGAKRSALHLALSESLLRRKLFTSTLITARAEIDQNLAAVKKSSTWRPAIPHLVLQCRFLWVCAPILLGIIRTYGELEVTNSFTDRQVAESRIEEPISPDIVWSVARLQEKSVGEKTSLRKCIRPLGWRSALLAKMSCARVCPYRSVG